MSMNFIHKLPIPQETKERYPVSAAAAAVKAAVDAEIARVFTGESAKKVLVATGLEYAGGFGDDVRQRAKDMGIRVVEGVQRMTEEELIRVVKSFWFN